MNHPLLLTRAALERKKPFLLPSVLLGLFPLGLTRATGSKSGDEELRNGDLARRGKRH